MILYQEFSKIKKRLGFCHPTAFRLRLGSFWFLFDSPYLEPFRHLHQTPPRAKRASKDWLSSSSCME